MLPARLPKAGTPTPPTETGRVRRPRTTPRPGASKPIAAPMADPGETETRTHLQRPCSLESRAGHAPSVLSGWTVTETVIPHTTTPSEQSTQRRWGRVSREPSRAELPAYQPALSDDRTGTGTDQGGRRRWRRKGARGAGRAAGDGRGPRGGWPLQAWTIGTGVSARCGQQVWRCGHWGEMVKGSLGSLPFLLTACSPTIISKENLY